MKAAILAAGRGSRLGALTAERPKCLVLLAGRTLLDWQLSALRSARVEDVALVTGYCAQALERPGLRTLHNPRWAHTNMAASLFSAAEFLRPQGGLVLYSDVVYHPQAIHGLLASEADVALSYDTRWLELWRHRFTDPLSDAETLRLDGQRIVEIGGRAACAAAIEGQYMGLMRFSGAGFEQLRDVWSQLPAERRDAIDMTALLAAALTAGIAVTGVPVEGRWCEVDSAADLALYEALVAAGPAGAWAHDWRWTEAAPA